MDSNMATQEFGLNTSHTDTVGPWAKQKLDAHESYLKAYHRVMQNQPFKLIYIDAFAGAGLFRVRKDGADESYLGSFFDDDQVDAENEFIAGSPVRALRAGKGFDQHYFFDTDPRRANRLQQLKRDYPDKTIEITVGDANAGVQKLARRFHKSPYARGVAFLDPYGPNLHWRTVEALAETRKVDVIINFPLAMAINRLIMRNAEIPENWVTLLDNCFGTHEWYDLAYDEVDDLFGVGEIQKHPETAERLLALYHRRLKNVFGYVVRPSLVKNTKGMPLYYLMWASSNRRGVPIAEHIMSLGERIRPPGQG